MGSCCSTTTCSSIENKPGAAAGIGASERTERLFLRKQNSLLRNNLLHQTTSDNPLNKYEIVKKLGVGSMGTVSLVRKKRRHAEEEKRSKQNDEFYAMKSIRLGRMSSNTARELRNEIAIVSDLDHPGIVKFYDVYYEGPKQQIYIIMELCSGGDLSKRGPYSEQQAQAIARQLFSAVFYMHDSRGYVHRDLKFENCMFEAPNSPNVMIIDFGLSCRFDPDRPLHAQFGTFETMAPEVFGGNYTFKCDLWSLGVISFELLCGQKPFASPFILGLINQISMAKYNFDAPGWRGKSTAAKDFCRALLQHDPQARPNAKAALKHPWLEKKASPAPTTPSLKNSTTTLKQDFHLYAKASMIEKLVALLVAHKTFPKDVLALRQQFEQLDADGSGVISLQEFKEVLMEKNHGDDNNRDETKELREIFDGLDVYHDGELSWTEFLAASIVSHGFLTEERVMEAFDDLDEDNSGVVSLENLRSIFGKDYDKLASKVEINSTLGDDRQISKEELLRFIREEQDQLTKGALLLSERKNKEQAV